MKRFVLVLVLALVAGSALAPEVAEAAAQAGSGAALGAQSLRPYAHVFAAYAVAWILVLGWVISIGRRLGRIEEEVGGGPEG